MKVRDAADLAIKLFGIYFLFLAIAHIIIVLDSGFDRHSGHNTAREWFHLLAYPGVMFLAGVVFIFGTDVVVQLIWRKKENTDLPNVGGNVAFWLSLIGVYYFIGSVASLGHEIYVGASREPLGGGSWITRHVANTLILVMSFLLVVKAPAIANLVMRIHGRTSEQGTVPPAESQRNADKG